jgi:thiamine biosynthesis lipoprotein
MTRTQPNSLAMIRARILPTIQTTATGNFHQLRFTAMSTVCRVDFVCDDAQLARQFQQAAWHWVAGFEAQYSRFIPDSLTGRINTAAGSRWVDVDADAENLFDLCQEMVAFTGGAFDPTVLPLLRLWNWKATPPTVPTEPAVAKTLELVGWHKVQRRAGGIFLPQQGMCLDLGGLGKEFAVDQVLTLALQRGITNVLVDFGQDLRVHGVPPERAAWFIGLENPQQPGNCWAGLKVTDHAVATSGDYARHFTADGRRYGHIIDPRNGYPVHNGCLSVSVVAPQCTLAGILSTATFVLGPAAGLALMRHRPGVEGAVITETNCFQTAKFSGYTTT